MHVSMPSHAAGSLPLQSGQRDGSYGTATLSRLPWARTEKASHVLTTQLGPEGGRCG
jgi:hypothetical protein